MWVIVGLLFLAIFLSLGSLIVWDLQDRDWLGLISFEVPMLLVAIALLVGFLHCRWL